MNVALFVGLAALLTIASKLPVSIAMERQGGGYDNHNPREQQRALQGWGKRALAAHQNAIEAFPLFVAGALVAYVGGGDPTWAERLCIVWLVTRATYNAAYIADLATFRSIVWTLAWAAALGLIGLPLFA